MPSRRKPLQEWCVPLEVCVGARVVQVFKMLAMYISNTLIVIILAVIILARKFVFSLVSMCLHRGA